MGGDLRGAITAAVANMYDVTPATETTPERRFTTSPPCTLDVEPRVTLSVFVSGHQHTLSLPKRNRVAASKREREEHDTPLAKEPGVTPPQLVNTLKPNNTALDVSE